MEPFWNRLYSGERPMAVGYLGHSNSERVLPRHRPHRAPGAVAWPELPAEATGYMRIRRSDKSQISSPISPIERSHNDWFHPVPRVEEWIHPDSDSRKPGVD
jgi:hypothetical protein